MRAPKQLSPGTIGMLAAVVTVIIWSSFIVIARASADPSRGGTLHAFDIVYLRLLGAGAILLAVGWWMVRRDQSRGTGASSLFGLSPLSLRRTVWTGLFGGSLYAALIYYGFVYAPAGHASVLLPGSLPLWTALFAAIILRTRVTPAGELLFQALFQGVGSVVISGITYTRMIQHFGPVRSTMITALVPGLSALAAVLFLGEPLAGNLLLGLALVSVGIVFGVRSVAPPTAAAVTAAAAPLGR